MKLTILLGVAAAYRLRMHREDPELQATMESLKEAESQMHTTMNVPEPQSVVARKERHEVVDYNTMDL